MTGDRTLDLVHANPTPCPLSHNTLHTALYTPAKKNETVSMATTIEKPKETFVASHLAKSPHCPENHPSKGLLKEKLLEIFSKYGH